MMTAPISGRNDRKEDFAEDEASEEADMVTIDVAGEGFVSNRLHGGQSTFHCAAALSGSHCVIGSIQHRMLPINSLDE